MLMPDFALEPTKMLALGFAFGAACEELGIGEGSLEVAKRERVSHFILKLVLKGEHDIAVLHRRAVIHFRNTASYSLSNDHGTR
jgi:hypothetical protein